MKIFRVYKNDSIHYKVLDYLNQRDDWYGRYE